MSDELDELVYASRFCWRDDRHVLVGIAINRGETGILDKRVLSVRTIQVLM